MSFAVDRNIGPDEFRELLPKSALSFRGYNQTNLGRTQELLKHPRYAEIVADYLRRAGDVCSQTTGRPANLIDRVQRGEETSLASYAEAVALVVSVELAQLKLLKEIFDIEYRQAMVSFGFSLGEVAAVIAGGILEMEDALKVPLAMSDDCIALADKVTLAILFSREQRLPADEVQRICLQINSEGQGVICVSTILAPNSMLLLCQGNTVQRFRDELNLSLPKRVQLRVKEGDWPPLHTSIMWQKAIPNRSAVLMQATKFRMEKPTPPILSLVTGKLSYDRYNAIEIMHNWVDYPQKLWDVIHQSLVMGVETYIHVGPEPNIVPATLKRLKDNIEGQSRASLGMRALSAVAQRPWLQAILPQRTALLRATSVLQINLEDWLLEQRDF
jgi:[acyl-carrier-protein] S-malonyltransferase